jgi:uncharacterized protein/uncharacterized protein YjbI with pentapeptide repeats
MLEILGPIALLALAANAEGHEPLSKDHVAAITDVCGQDEQSKFVDARKITSADELANKIESLYLPIAVVYGAKLARQDVTRLLEKMEYGCFYEADLSGTRAAGGELKHATIIKSSIEEADWSGVELDEIRFIGVNAKNANLSGANLRGGLWRGAFWKSSLEKTDFTGALLLGFRFECGITLDEDCGGGRGANFKDADLSAADLADYPIWGEDSFDQAFFEGTRLHPRALLYLDRFQIGNGVELSAWRRAGDKHDVATRVSEEEFLSLRADALATRIDAPSFDCSKARGYVEKEICGEYSIELRALDREMADAWERYNAGRRVSNRSQRNWLRKRNQCAEYSCIRRSYVERIAALQAHNGAAIILAPDAMITFHQDVLPLSDKMRASALYSRIVPVLEQAAMGQVRLTGLEDGSIRIEGEAVGANAHLCGWEADTFYDAKTGWYSARSENGKPVPLFRVHKGVLTPRYSGNIGDTPPEAGQFISCGARASFGKMRALSDELD